MNLFTKDRQEFLYMQIISKYSKVKMKALLVLCSIKTQICKELNNALIIIRYL